MNRRDARMLARYNAWANKVLFDAVAVLPEIVTLVRVGEEDSLYTPPP